MIRIIHTSDFHQESENLSIDKKRIVEAMIKDLMKYDCENIIFIVSGDLVDKGGKDFSNKKIVFPEFEKNYIDLIIEAFPKWKGKIFIVPGNHDVVRSKIDKVTEQGLKSLLSNSTEVTDFIVNNRDNSVHLQRLEDYKSWEKSFYLKYNETEASNFDTSFILNMENYSVGISCLNSSWLCKDDSDKGQLLIGKAQVQNALDKIADCNIKIAIVHHPLEFLKEFDREECRKLILKEYDFLLTGHVHELSSSYTQDLAGNIFISIANSTIADNPNERKFVNGYTILDFYPNNKTVAHYRRYEEDHQKFVSNTSVGSDTGTREFVILKDEKLQKFEKNHDLIISMENRHLENLNEHIIISNAYTEINCTVENLFVEPTILNTPHGNIEEDEKLVYTIESITNDSSNSNYLIFGLKESGKTLLLDKIFIDCIRKFNSIQKIPVLLKFGQFEKDVVKLIKEFLGISSSVIGDYIKNNEIILLIDDFKISEDTTAKLSKLQNFVTEYPNVQIVATVTQYFENIIPASYLLHNAIFNFNFCFIQPLNSKEIKMLVNKWFNGRENDLKENMERLIKSFIDFGLPKNPLSVTLFLWIFEKQEKRPINKSVLVEIFVENLLEKTKIENIYSDTFDFNNKKRLLSFIAKFMHDKGNPLLSYSVKYPELLPYVDNYISARAEIQPQRLLQDFVTRGILHIDDSNNVTFKSAFFFHYFLCLQLDIDMEFREHVFTDDRYLNYVEEISYYTGLKRDDINILKFTQNKLEEAFTEFNEDIKADFERIDKIFENKSNNENVSFHIDEKDATTKVTDKQLDEIYDSTLSSVPIKKEVESKNENLATTFNIDLVLRLASVVLKNSEEVDDFELKKTAYSKIVTSSIAFLMIYRDSLLTYFSKNKKGPENFPKNINFNLFIKILPMIHQIVLFDWLGSQKLRPIISDKILADSKDESISEFEKFISIFIYSDIKGRDYPEVVQDFVRQLKPKYLKDLSFLKILSYYKLRNNSPELDEKWLRLMAEIKNDLGQIKRQSNGRFIEQLKKDKRNKF